MVPEREVVVCSADEGQQARNSCPELPIFFFLLASHGVLCSCVYEKVAGERAGINTCPPRIRLIHETTKRASGCVLVQTCSYIKCPLEKLSITECNIVTHVRESFIVQQKCMEIRLLRCKMFRLTWT